MTSLPLVFAHKLLEDVNKVWPRREVFLVSYFYSPFVGNIFYRFYYNIFLFRLAHFARGEVNISTSSTTQACFVEMKLHQ